MAVAVGTKPRLDKTHPGLQVIPGWDSRLWCAEGQCGRWLPGMLQLPITHRRERERVAERPALVRQMKQPLRWLLWWCRWLWGRLACFWVHALLQEGNRPETPSPPGQGERIDGMSVIF